MKEDNINRFERVIGRSLQIGVAASAAIISAGLILLFVTGKTGYTGNSFPTNPLEVLRGAFMLKPYAVILTGLFVLILTPVARVGVSVIAFLKEKDYAYVIITAAVFIILIISFLLGKVQ
jgi:uncharacterized membrane protein